MPEECAVHGIAGGYRTKGMRRSRVWVTLPGRPLFGVSAVDNRHLDHMTAELATAAVHSLWNDGNRHPIDECAAREFVAHLPPDGDRVGADGLVEHVADLRSALPDLVFRVHDTVRQQNRVVMRTRLAGTQRGEFLGVPPTNRPVVMTQLMFLEFDRENWLRELWCESNPLSVLDQLGVLPPERAGPLRLLGHTVSTIARFAYLSAKGGSR